MFDGAGRRYFGSLVNFRRDAVDIQTNVTTKLLEGRHDTEEVLVGIFVRLIHRLRVLVHRIHDVDDDVL